MCQKGRTTRTQSSFEFGGPESKLSKETNANLSSINFFPSLPVSPAARPSLVVDHDHNSVFLPSRHLPPHQRDHTLRAAEAGGP